MITVETPTTVADIDMFSAVVLSIPTIFFNPFNQYEFIVFFPFP